MPSNDSGFNRHGALASNLTPYGSLVCHLLVIVITLLIHHIEESQLVDTLACRHHTQPVTELLLLEEFLRPINPVSLVVTPSTNQTHKYFRYRPEKGMYATTLIFSPSTWLICTLSPKFPVRPSTLMRSCRNFSNAARSKILSLTGWLQLMVYF